VWHFPLTVGDGQCTCEWDSYIIVNDCCQFTEWFFNWRHLYSYAINIVTCFSNLIVATIVMKELTPLITPISNAILQNPNYILTTHLKEFKNIQYFLLEFITRVNVKWHCWTLNRKDKFYFEVWSYDKFLYFASAIWKIST